MKASFLFFILFSDEYLGLIEGQQGMGRLYLMSVAVAWLTILPVGIRAMYLAHSCPASASTQWLLLCFIFFPAILETPLVAGIFSP